MQTVTPADVQTYLGLPSIDADRAQMLIDDAVAQALSVVTVGTVPETGATVDNLPTGAESVIRSAVARLYLNPTGVTTDSAGPFSIGRPASSGSMLSKNERAALRRLAGRVAGAFTVDPTPASALADFTDPLAQPTYADTAELLMDQGI